jgi:uncharacterized membrane protein YgcG
MADDPPRAAPVAGAGSSGGAAQTVYVVERPSYVPPVSKPKYSGERGVGKLRVFLAKAKLFHEAEVAKGLSDTGAVKYIGMECLTGAAETWFMCSGHSAEWKWSTFKHELGKQFLSPTDVEDAGYALMYSTYQNASLVVEYNSLFLERKQDCDLVGYKCDDNVLKTVYVHGLNKDYKKVLALRPTSSVSYQEDMSYLARAESQAGGKITFVDSQPRDKGSSSNNNSNNGNKYRHPNSGNKNKNNNNYNNNNNTSSNNNNNNSGQSQVTHAGNNAQNNASPSDSTAGRGAAGSSSGGHNHRYGHGHGGGRGGGGGHGGGRGGGHGPRDLSHITCNRCGEPGHVSADCMAPPEKVAAFKASKNK